MSDRAAARLAWMPHVQPLSLARHLRSGTPDAQDCHSRDRHPAVTWHIHMSLRVEARITEDFAVTLDRFSQLVQREYERPWYKRRYGSYEPPSVLRRKHSKMRELRLRSNDLKLRIDSAAQLRRTRPTNAAGY